MAKRIWHWAPAAAWVVITFIVSHQPVVVIPFGAPDYMAHAINYGVLSILLVWAIAGGQWQAMTPPVMALAIVLALVLGILDEFHQSFVPGREPSVRDVIADAVGACAGACVATIAVSFRRRHIRPT